MFELDSSVSIASQTVGATNSSISHSVGCESIWPDRIHLPQTLHFSSSSSSPSIESPICG